AALRVLGETPISNGRRIAVIGDMLELGENAAALHVALASSLQHYPIDLVFCVGPLTRPLFEALPRPLQGGWAATSAELKNEFTSSLREGDVVMVKGSNSVRMNLLIEALKRVCAQDAVA